jgi:hypothetical protein
MLASPEYEGTFPELHRQAKAFIPAFNRLYDELLNHLTNECVFLDRSRSPAWFRGTYGQATLFSNLLYRTSRPMTFKAKQIDQGGGFDASFPMPRRFGGEAYPWRMEFDPEEDKPPPAEDAGAVLGGTREVTAPLQTARPTTEIVQPVTEALNAFMCEERLRATKEKYLSDSFVELNAAVMAQMRRGGDTEYHAALGPLFDNVFSRENKSMLHLGGSAERSEEFRALMEQVLCSTNANLLDDESGVIRGTTHFFGAAIDRAPDFCRSTGVLCQLLKVIILYKSTENVLDPDDEVLLNSHLLLGETCLGSAINAYQFAVGASAIIQLLLHAVDSKTYLPALDGNESLSIENAFLRKVQDLGNSPGLRLLSALRSPEGRPEQAVPLDTEPNAKGLRYITFDANRLSHPTLVIDNDTYVRSCLTMRDNVYASFKKCTDQSQQDFWACVTLDFPSGPGENADNDVPSDGRAAFFGAGPRTGGRYLGTLLGGPRRRAEDEDTGAGVRSRARLARSRQEYEGEKDPEDLSGLWDNSSPTMCRRLGKLRSEPEHLTRIVRACLLGTHIKYRVFLNIIRQNDVFPFGFLLLRPRMTYMMGTGILTVAGAATGETFIGHSDFQLADNVVQKMHYGNFTMYIKSIVKNQKNVFLAENIYAQGYVSGNGVEFFTPESSQRMPHDSSVGAPSIFSCLVPYSEGARLPEQYFMQELPNPLDITGKHSTANPELSTVTSAQRGENHFATSGFYSRLHGWTNAVSFAPQASYGTSNRWNTLTFQGHQAMYSPHTQNHDLVQVNTGHWGPKVYAGCGKVRRGMQKVRLRLATSGTVCRLETEFYLTSFFSPSLLLFIQKSRRSRTCVTSPLHAFWSSENLPPC